MKTALQVARVVDVPVIAKFIEKMQFELQELNFNKQSTIYSVKYGIEEGVVWFIFLDENQSPFGTCHVQSIHRYWTTKRRYYLGGFYIDEDYRGAGRFKEIYKLLKDWVIDQGGDQIYSHINKDNEKSLASFGKVGMKDEGYLLMIDHWGEDE